jgi:hypothetical protein
MEADDRGGVSADPDIRWPATVQRSRRSDRRQAGSRADAEQFLAHRPISKGEGDDGLYTRPALPVQPRPDRTAIAGIGALRGQGQAIRRGQCWRFFGPSRRQAGHHGGGTGCCARQARQTVRPEGHRLPGEFEWTPRDQCACRTGLRRRHPGQSVRRGARQTAPGVERRDQRSSPFAGHPARSRTSPKSGTRRSSPATAWWRSAIPSMDC